MSLSDTREPLETQQEICWCVSSMGEGHGSQQSTAGPQQQALCAKQLGCGASRGQVKVDIRHMLPALIRWRLQSVGSHPWKQGLQRATLAPVGRRCPNAHSGRYIQFTGSHSRLGPVPIEADSLCGYSTPSKRPASPHLLQYFWAPCTRGATQATPPACLLRC